MALPSSGNISLQALQNEYGGAHPISLSEYASKIGKSPGQRISLADFHGKSSLRVAVSADTTSPTATRTPGGTAIPTAHLSTSVSGQSGSVSYRWSKSAGCGSVVTSTTNSIATVSFTADYSHNDGQCAGVFRCTVTDSAGTTALDEIHITFKWSTQSVGGGGGDNH